MYQKSLRILFSVLLLLAFRHLSAQCDYRLEMFDIFGDGWNNGSLTITVGGNAVTYTLNNFNDDGIDSTVYFSVVDGAPITLSWTAGFFDEEVAFSIFDYEDNLVFQTTDPASGTLFSGTAICPPCLKPQNVVIENIWDTRMRASWTPVGSNPGQSWLVIYGPPGFVPGPGSGDTAVTFLPRITLTGLQKKTAYDFYVLQDCGDEGISDLAGPFSFLTYWSNDVGIADVLSPVSSCSLGVEKVTIVMKNYGANPQSLIPFRYTVNGVDAGVGQPNDGFFTGVLGKDSCETLEFETQFDFSEPGEYLITVFTEMGGDEDGSNDTFHYRIVNRLIAPYVQLFNDWGGGWYVDTTASINPTWAFGEPDGTVISSAATGSNAWVTNLSGNYLPAERSYLHSPCFDFSGLTDDPVIEFSIQYVTETSYDGGYLEYSIDGGANWDKVGALGEGLNWYNFINFNTNLGDVWAGNSNGWQTARHRLFGVAGESEVLLRFAFGADPSVQLEGMGVDDIRIYVPQPNDLAGLEVATAGDAVDCGLEADAITFRFSNFGTQPQDTFTVAYSVNGGAPVSETIPATLLPDEQYTHTFTVPFDSRDGVFEIRCWTDLADEDNSVNDTVVYTISHIPRALPFQEDFESGLLPGGWTSNGFVTNQHSNVSNVLAFNLWSFAPGFNHTIPRYGVIGPTDSLYFDYRITNFSGNGTVPTVLAPGSKLDVMVSTDCGANFQVVQSINFLNHQPSAVMQTRKVPLGQFAGESILIRFRGTWTGGDFWVDIDNINLRACPASMLLSATTLPADPGQSNGSATVSVGAGNPPYTYLWSNGSTSATANNLPNGEASVTVTDALGCSDVLTVFIGSTSTNDIEGLQELSLRPNPTTGLAWLTLGFDRPVDLRVQLVSLLGQTVWESHGSYVSRLTEEIDLSRYPAGLYLLRITADGQTRTEKVVRQ